LFLQNNLALLFFREQLTGKLLATTCHNLKTCETLQPNPPNVEMRGHSGLSPNYQLKSPIPRGVKLTGWKSFFSC